MPNKDETLYCRLTPAMKARIETEASSRGESVSLIVREALEDYLAALDAERKATEESANIISASPRRK